MVKASKAITRSQDYKNAHAAYRTGAPRYMYDFSHSARKGWDDAKNEHENAVRELDREATRTA